MRLLHLADLHLGKKLNEAPLLEDQRFILGQILAVLDREQAEAVLIAGDVYDKPVPPAEAVSLLDDFLTRLSLRGVPVILISGNHDSAERLAFGARLLAGQKVFLAPAYDAAHAAVQPVRLKDAHGEICVWPLPFLKPAHVRAAFPELPIITYTDALRAAIAAMPLEDGMRNVLVCHQFLTGSERSESEEVSVGGLDNVDASVFERFDYVALGHLHRAQQVGRPSVRYAGSPLKYSFSEARDSKSVTLIDLGAKGDVSIRAVPLSPRRELRELRGAYDELTLRANYQHTATDDYLRVILTDEDDVPDALARLQTIYPNLLSLSYDNARTRLKQTVDAAEAPERRTPLELLADFYALQNNRPLSSEQAAYASALLERIQEGKA